MAKYVFFVDRRNRGEEPIRCVADLPVNSAEDLLKFKGGMIDVQANGSTFQIEVDPAQDLVERSLRIQLQKVRDLVLPKEDAATSKITKRNQSGFQA